MSIREVHLLGGQRGDPTPHLHRKLFRTPGGAEVTLGECLQKGHVYTAPAPSQLTRALESQGFLVIQTHQDDPLLEAVLDRRPTEASAAYTLPRPAQETAGPLCRAVYTLLQKQGARLQEVQLGHLDDNDRLAGVGRPGQLTRNEDLDRLPMGLLARKATVILNADHPLLPTLIRTAEREPYLAAYLLAKLFLRPDAAQDTELALSAWRAR